jgi:ABC-type branched-subunit amino acid transport system substrate-binding protein
VTRRSGRRVPRFRAGVPVVFVIVVAVLALSIPAAFGQQTTTPPPTTASPSATGTPGFTATSVRVGGLGWALEYGGADVGARARFARANASGGVNGRTIDYVGFRDDGGDPATSAKAAQQLVQQDHVFAVVPAVTPVLSTADLVAANVPYFGWALSSQFCATKLGFGFNGCLLPPSGAVTSGAWGAVLAQAVGGQAQGKTVAVLTENTDSGMSAFQSASASVTAAGFDVVMGQRSLPVPAVGDFDGLAKKVMSSSSGKAPDVVLAVGSYSNVVLAKAALADAGFKGVFTDSIEYDPQLVAGAEGAMVFVQTAPVESAKTVPAMQQLVDDVHKLAPTQPIDPAVIAGYLSADLFLQVLAQRPADLSTASFLKAANRFSYEVPGVVGPTKFPKARTQPTPCGSLVQSDGTAFSVKVPYTCSKVVPVE